MKRTIRLTESELRHMISESVKKVLNEIGETDKFHDILGMSDGYNSYMGNTQKSNRAYGLSTQLQKNQNNGQLYDPKSEESAAKYRKNTRAYQGGFSKGWEKAKAEKEKLKNQVAESVRRALLRETIEGHNFAKIKRPNGYETIDVDIDSTIPYISIGSWEAEGQEAQEAIDIISDVYNKTGDYNLAIKEYIDNY